MAKDPAVLFYYQDFLVGTNFMSDEEVGKYIRILCHLADKQYLTEKQVQSICKASAITDNILCKLIRDENGNYYNARMRDEQEKRKKFTESRRNNASSKKAYAQHMEDENENENTNEDVIIKDITPEVVEKWNSFADQNGLGKIIKLSQKRKLSVGARFIDKEFDFDKILDEIKKSEFLRGSTGWKVDFDFIFCSQNNYLKILEGKYRNAVNQQSTRQGSATERAKFRHSEQSLKDNADFLESLRERDKQRSGCA